MKKMKSCSVGFALSLLLLLGSVDARAAVFNGNLTNRNQADFYSIDVSASGGVAAITAVSGDVDTILTLLDSLGNVLTYNDDIEDDTLASSIVAIVPAGIYRFVVTAYENLVADGPTFSNEGDDSDIGPYSINIFAESSYSAAFDKSVVTPLPAALPLLATGLLMLGAVRAIRKRGSNELAQLPS